MQPNVLAIILIILMLFVVMIFLNQPGQTTTDDGESSEYLEGFSHDINQYDAYVADPGVPQSSDIPLKNAYQAYRSAPDNRYQYFARQQVYLLPCQYLDFSNPFHRWMYYYYPEFYYNCYPTVWPYRYPRRYYYGYYDPMDGGYYGPSYGPLFWRHYRSYPDRYRRYSRYYPQRYRRIRREHFNNTEVPEWAEQQTVMRLVEGEFVPSGTNCAQEEPLAGGLMAFRLRAPPTPPAPAYHPPTISPMPSPQPSGPSYAPMYHPPTISPMPSPQARGPSYAPMPSPQPSGPSYAPMYHPPTISPMPSPQARGPPSRSPVSPSPQPRCPPCPVFPAPTLPDQLLSSVKQHLGTSSHQSPTSIHQSPSALKYPTRYTATGNLE